MHIIAILRSLIAELPFHSDAAFLFAMAIPILLLSVATRVLLWDSVGKVDTLHAAAKDGVKVYLSGNVSDPRHQEGLR